MQNKTPTILELKELSLQVSLVIPYITMLVLFGSRATGNIRANSDWDFAILYDKEKYDIYQTSHPLAFFELYWLFGELFKLNSDHIDVVDLHKCSELKSHFVARDGIMLFEKTPGEFEAFRLNSLKSESELKQFCENQYQHIESFLQRWGV
ncbi:type VII toxin-antitoxin system MntA family adenylyltransferase antitoxin [Anabaena azotica]|uniref:type VII toxin-antitoxin system MntA family adenylyltransferase antitoxin n=1 Tax=Anabaena azotica TaxID=197653 RepID=UPI0039A60FCF